MGWREVLKVVAKVGLDAVIGSKRTDELLQAFRTELPGATPADVAAAKEEVAAHPEALRAAVELAGTDTAATADQLDLLAVNLATGFAEADADATQPFEQLRQIVLPGRSKTFVMWFDAGLHPDFGPGRYCHFNWDGESWRVRDYVGDWMYHPPGRATGKGPTRFRAVAKTALEVWRAGVCPVQCLRAYGLHATEVGNADRWREVLALLTRAAELWQARAPG